MQHFSISVLAFFKKLDSVSSVIKDEEDGYTEMLEMHLLYYKFNDADFIAYKKEKLAAAALRCYNMHEQYEMFCKYEKHLKSQQQRPGPAYCMQSPDIKSILLSCVKAELHFLEKKTMRCRRGGTNDRTLNPQQQSAEHPAYRIKTSLSVDGLAFLLRLLIEVAAIEGSPRKDLLLFICRSVGTPRTGSGPIGFESMLSKYKQPVQSTVEAIKALLKKMLKLLEEKYG
jgi:hypothetical protein